MIVAKLMGGLGNQMFQYAFTRKLSSDLKTDLMLDISFLQDKSFKENFTYRDFELDVFKIQATLANESNLQKFSQNKFVKIIHHIYSFTPFKPQYQYLREPHFHFFSKALNSSVNCYLDGYWQSEKYFSSIRKELLAEFSPQKEVSDKTKELMLKINSCNAISLHIRRGDYVTNAHNNSYHGTCSLEYYNRAISFMRNKITDAEFFIFSDEPAWFKENVKIDFPVQFITHNTGKNSYQDLILMSLCKHNIIANSSFSWWGAWLNQNQNKIVIAPKLWFNDKSKNTKDLLPENWVKI
jgi:hypothetical protein